LSRTAALANPRAKLARADEHLENLRTEVAAFMEGEPLGVAHEELGRIWTSLASA
jgi:hypothetical protein